MIESVPGTNQNLTMGEVFLAQGYNGSFDAVRTHDWQVSTDDESGVVTIVYKSVLTGILMINCFNFTILIT